MINEFICDEDLKIIKENIISQCCKFSTVIENNESLFYENYTKMRTKQSITAAILSAFKPNQKYGSLTCKEIKYGLGMYQPELSNDKVIIHFYNYANSLNSNIIKKYILQYNYQSSLIKYFVILYNTDKKGNFINLVVRYISLKDNIDLEYIL